MGHDKTHWVNAASSQPALTAQNRPRSTSPSTSSSTCMQALRESCSGVNDAPGDVVACPRSSCICCRF